MSDIEEEKKKTKIWMIISIIAILIGITLLVVVIILLVSRSEVKPCPPCVISRAKMAKVGKSIEVLSEFQAEVKSLASLPTSCNSSKMTGTCDIAKPRLASLKLRRK